jgi:hypothetical protein
MRRVCFAALAALALASCGSNGPAAGNDGTKQAEEPRLTVTDLAELRGTDYLVADVVDGEDYDSFSLKSSSAPAVRNLLLIRRDDGSSRALLPDNRWRVVQTYFTAARAGPPLASYSSYSGSSSGASDGTRRIDDEAAPAYFVVEGRATAEQRPVSVRVGTLADMKSAVVLNDLIEVTGLWMIDDHRLALIARRGAKTEYFEIDMATKAVIGSHAIDVGVLTGE